ncbi:MAG TPA: XdhC family protein [Pyrinomonadaceae bacterium]|nr:XdhC family protein [Pyrinomonadaceae bacterium]
MIKELETWRFAAERLKQNEPVMLLVVAESSGSSPGRRGFKMAVSGDDMSGSIGGGVMEINLVEQARGLLSADAASAEASRPLIKQQDHQKNSTNPSGMICSGTQTVIFYLLDGSHYKTVGKIIDALEENEAKILRITADEFSIKESLENGVQSIAIDRDSAAFIYEEKLGYKNKLFIVGGGHCALALSELMSRMDFYIELFDDRPDLNTLDKNKYVHKKTIIESYENIAEFIPEGNETNFVVVMTLGYQTDELVIRKLIDKELKYFGVLGSKAKMGVLLKELEKEGFPKEKLDLLHTPIGLPINSQTPEEIAVSIAAQIIAVKNSAK